MRTARTIFLLCTLPLLEGCGPSSGRLDAAFRQDGARGPYTYEGVRIEGRSAILASYRGPEGEEVAVRLTRRDERIDAFTRTDRCNVFIDHGTGEDAPTPESLGMHVTGLAERLAPALDEACLGLHPPSSAHPSVRRIVTLATTFAYALGAAIVLLMLASPLIGSGRMTGRLFAAGLGAVTLLGLLLRAWELDLPFVQSVIAERIHLADGPVLSFVVGSKADPRHPPLTSLVLNVAMSFGRHEWLLRLPFVLAGAASVTLVGLLARRLCDPWAGLVAACAAAVCPPLVLMSRTIGSHALFTALLPLTCLAMLALHESPTGKRARLLVAANSVSLWTSYFAIVPLLVQASDALVSRKRNRPYARHLGRALLHSCLIGSIPLVFMVVGFVRDLGSKRVMGRAHAEFWGSLSRPLDFLADVDSEIGRALVLTIVVFSALLLVARRLEGVSVLRTFLVGWGLPVVILVLASTNFMRSYYVAVSLPVVIPLAVAGVVGAARVASSLTSRRVVRSLVMGAAGMLASVLVVVGVRDLGARAAGLYDPDQHSGISRAVARIGSGGPDTIVLLHRNTKYLLAYYLLDGDLSVHVCRQGTCHVGPYRVLYLVTNDDMRDGVDWMERAAGRFDAETGRRKVWFIGGFPDTGAGRELESRLKLDERCLVDTEYENGVRLYVCG